MDALTFHLSPVDRAKLRDSLSSLVEVRALREQTAALYQTFKHTSFPVYGAEGVRETLEKLDEQLFDMVEQTEELKLHLLKSAFIALAKTLAASEGLPFVTEDTTWGHVLVFEGVGDTALQDRLFNAFIGALKPYQKDLEYDLVFHKTLNLTAFTFFTDGGFVDGVLEDIAAKRAA